MLSGYQPATMMEDIYNELLVNPSLIKSNGLQYCKEMLKVYSKIANYKNCGKEGSFTALLKKARDNELKVRPIFNVFIQDFISTLYGNNVINMSKYKGILEYDDIKCISGNYSKPDGVKISFNMPVIRNEYANKILGVKDEFLILLRKMGIRDFAEFLNYIAPPTKYID